ncbi:hypothetical protein SBRCBS47491_002154 [Sporothrix bragantina]|uniref:Alpha-xylosidase n=1 Tax=Sporothrix bragantina TaxID=671064 RepID=A0ABP0B4R4_9PEZI
MEGMAKYKFPCNPVADAASTVTGPQYRFTLIGDMVLRYEWASDGVFEDRASTFALNRRFSGVPVPKFTVTETDDRLEIVTPTLHLSYDKQRFSANGLHVTFGAKVTLWGAEWRFGSEDASNLGGTARTLDEIDGRCDMGQGILSPAGYAALDDSQSMLFDGEGFVAPRRAGSDKGDRIDGYLFCYGRDYAGAMRAFYAISGQPPRIPRWALGNWWSRFHRYTAESYLRLMDRFAAEQIPLSVAVIDMDWHLVNDERVPHAGWTGYTWDKSLFPDPTAFGEALHDRQLKVTLNDHPHLGIHHHEDLYESMATALGRDPTTKSPIAFDPTDPLFMDAWLNVLHRALEKQGCDFWWIDWQQGPLSRVPGLDPLWLLNHFHFLDNRLQAAEGDGKDGDNSRGLIFSRYAGPGSHRYPVGFSGDSITTWASLQFQPEFTATAANIGYGWWSHDIGGHMHGGRDDELATRWLQLGVFSPVLRLHSSNSPWASKEPWLYRKEYYGVMRRAMQLRHRLVPYLYASASGDLPLVRPMYWAHPTRDEAYAYPNQYTFGPSLIVAPIVHKRDVRTGRSKAKVWVPPQRHVDLFTGCVYDGDRELDMYRTIDCVPVLAPEGSIIPLDGNQAPENGCHNPVSLEVLVVIGRDGRFRLVEDPLDDAVPKNSEASNNRERIIEIDFQQTTGQLKITADNVASKNWSVRFVSLPKADKIAVSVDGVPLPGEDVVVRVDDGREDASPGPSPPGLVVTLPKLPQGSKTVTIDVGPNPQLAVHNHRETIHAMLLDVQADFAVKDAIWKIVDSTSSTQSTGVKLGRLLSLGLDEALVGPVVELLAADGRV